MEGRRWGDGLHQAVEAKEGVEVQQENQTLASITFQNYFRLYETISGMTGTADTEAFELRQIYGLDVVVIPTHLPLQRKDYGDRFYVTRQEKYVAILDEIKRRHEVGQPILVGTASIESSEHLSEMLVTAGIPHQVLNAKHHEREAEIISQAGCIGAVTIATNMAGRGTDIVLGGNISSALLDAEDAEKKRLRSEWHVNHQTVLALGGLHVIGAERNESRRIDNQLRGRSGRQGDPGSSQYFLALDDSLMRIFASDRVSFLMRKLGMKEGDTLEHPMLTRSIENAQRRVEGHNFDIRKQLLRFDDITNDQRKLVYQQRFEILAMSDVQEVVQQMLTRVVAELVEGHLPEGSMSESWLLQELEALLAHEFGLNIHCQSWLQEEPPIEESMVEGRILEAMRHVYRQKRTEIGEEMMKQVERAILLQTLDHYWREHLAGLTHLRMGIQWRSYAQKDPMQEYERESFTLFEHFLAQVKRGTIGKLMTVQVTVNAADAVREQAQHAMQPNHFLHPDVQEGERISRNAPCPCGSDRKYKHCHGQLEGTLGSGI
jgi:preprotein translocase subunit SecA